MRQLEVVFLVEMNVCNFIKEQFGEGPTFSFVCTAKCLAEVFVFQFLPVHPSISIQKKALPPEIPNPQQIHSYKNLRDLK